ncbi:MAG: pyridoxamine 5'-phosphate oxidase family protein [Dehalococcoidia bacterium]|nr:pyridoxamine 5'-phosphate oxidase family protein [Dehalococcoidia bacterium]
MPWKDLESADPELAAFGRERLHGRVAYLGTARPGGAPRVHPVTPIIGEGRIFVFMEPTSPKGRDLDLDPRFALHCAVSGNSGESGEFALSGEARRLHDSDSRALAVRFATYETADRYVLFELHPTAAMSTSYGGGRPARRQWNGAR